MGFLGNILGINTKPKTKEAAKKELGELETGQLRLWAKYGFGMYDESSVKARIKYLKAIIKTY